MEPAVFDFWERVHAIREKDPRYRREAYEFVMRGLEHTTQRVVGQRRHVSGQELLRGLIDLARQDYGELAWAVFTEWGVTRIECRSWSGHPTAARLLTACGFRLEADLAGMPGSFCQYALILNHGEPACA